MSVLLKTIIGLFDFNTTLVLAISALLLYFYKYRRWYYLASKVNGPFGWPLIGRIFDFQDTDVIIPSVMRYHEKYGETVRLWFGPWLAFLISKPEHLQAILPAYLDKDRRVYHRTYDFIEQGLIFLDVEPWKAHRKIINPAFNQKILESYMGIFTAETNILVKILEKEIGRPSFDAFMYIDRCSMDIICESAMDTRVDAQTGESELYKAFGRLLNVLIQRVFRIWLHIDWLWFRNWRGKEYLRLRDVIHTYTEGIINNKRKQLKNQKKEPVKKVEAQIGDDIPIPKRKAFLEILLEGEGSTFTEKELRHEVSTFVNTGTDTIAVGCSMILVSLGMHPEIQETVAKELDDIFGNSDRDITLEDLPNLIYLEQVMKESMRLYPPVPFIVRRIEKETNVGDYVFPADSSAFISIVGTHRNPKTWPDPMRFDPNRFLPEETAKRHSYSWIPFSAGPRNCIGMRYAMMLMKVILSSILRKYVIKTNLKPEDLSFNYEVVMKPIGGFQIMLEKRVK